MRLYKAIIILIFLLSAIFRLGFYDEIVFKEDESATALDFYDLAKASQFPPLFTKGKSGIYAIHILDRVPWYIIMLFAKDPRLLTVLSIGVPNTLAVIFCFLFCYRFINRRTALLATGLFGFSGWNILYSKNLWALNLQPFYSVLLFLSLSYLVYYRKSWSIVATVLLSLLIYDLHSTSLSLIISVFLILLIYGYIYKKKYLLSSFLLGGILLLVNKKVNIIIPNFSLKSFIFSLKFITRDDLYYSHLRVLPEFPSFENFSIIFLRAIFIFGCIYIIKRIFHSLRTKQFSSYIIVGAWFFSFVISFGFTTLKCHAHYFVVVFPALFIITAIGFDSLINYILGKERISKWEILLTFSIFTFWNPFVILLIMLLKYIKVNKKLAVSSLNACIILILSYQCLTNLRLYNSIKNEGGVPGIPGLDLGSKINAVKFVIQDAQERYRQTGLVSGYSIENDEGYGYIFKYLAKEKMDFLSEGSPPKGFHYIIIGDVNKNLDAGEDKKRIGSKLIIIEKIDEK